MKKKINNTKKVIAVLTCGLLVSLFAVAGCGSQSSSDNQSTSNAAQEEAETVEVAEYTIDTYPLNLMDELATAKTVEEANAIIGSDGEQVDEEVTPASAVTVTKTTYEWDLGNDVTIEGVYTTNDGEGDSYRDSEFAEYTIDFPSSDLAASQLVDFSNWDEIKAQHETGNLNYDGLVELLGGVPGIKKEVSTKDSYQYYWYNEDGGYLSVGSGPAGNLGIALSGRF